MKHATPVLAMLAALGLICSGCKKEKQNQDKAGQSGGAAMAMPAGMPAAMPAGMPADMPAGMPAGTPVDMPAGTPAGTPADMATAPPVAPKAQYGTLGLKHCDAYVALWKCTLPKLPATAQTQSRAAFGPTYQGWKAGIARVGTNAVARKLIDDGCKTLFRNHKQQYVKETRGCK